jgi:hypothetical protein
MDHDTRAMLCLLANLSTEAGWCEWVQLQNVERVALRASLAVVITDHWEREKKQRPLAHALSEAGLGGPV